MKALLTSPHTGKKVAAKGLELWDLALLKASGYYDISVRTLLSMERLPRGMTLPPGFKWKIPLTMLMKQAERGSFRKFRTFRGYAAGELAAGYFIGMMSAFFTREIHTAPTLHKIALECLHGMEMYADASKHRTQQLYARRLILSLLQYLVECSAANEKLVNTDHRPGAFSAIRLSELPLLATRADSVVARYGRKRVEKVFEHQLSLIFQSFGFQVVSTRLAQSTVDLFCISSDASEGYSFIVEAKTTKAKYSLPTRDARALKDYANDINSALRSLPQLKFVLVVANEPAKTLPSKIMALSASLGVPVRFCTASQIAELREVIPGPLPATTFRDEILQSDALLPVDFAGRVGRSYETLQGAHVEFAEQLLSVHKGQLPKPESSG